MEISLLEKKQNKNRARKIIKDIEKLKLKLREMETMKTPNILANMFVEEIKGIHTRYGRKFKISDQYKIDNLKAISKSQDM